MLILANRALICGSGMLSADHGPFLFQNGKSWITRDVWKAKGGSSMAVKKNRSIKVVSQSGYNYRETPTIILKGLWLAEAGFQIGDYVSVSCEEGRLVITPDMEKAKMAEAEKVFIEQEMKALEKRAEAEKKKLHVQYVAEQTGSLMSRLL